MYLKTLTIVTFLFSLSACDTVYQPLQWDGGYQDKKLAKDHYWILYLGNTTTSIAWVTRSWHRRASELCPKGYRTLNMIEIIDDDKTKKSLEDTILRKENPKLEGEIICPPPAV